jgi:hypothetical protein
VTPTNRWRDFSLASLQVEVAGDELVVTLPESRYWITYDKPAESGCLLARNIPYSDDPRSQITLSAFLAGASRAANEKARELGWI